MIFENLVDYIIGVYVEMRKEVRNSKDIIFISVRILLVIFRLFIVFVRLRLVDVVEKEDVNEVMRFMEMFKDFFNFVYEMYNR